MGRSSFAERNKAIREAWNNEVELVKEGRGTREWTPEQQKDILEKGRAYDDSGKAFEGQHMKSAAEYPEFQGDPGNIQFLTRTEHLEAHDGNWKNPTNWYYNPVTKEKIDFGDGPFIPCEVIDLSEPIISISIKDSKIEEQTSVEKNQTRTVNDTSTLNMEQHNEEHINPRKFNSTGEKIQKQSKFIRGLKWIGTFVVEHPMESLQIAGVVIGGTVKAVSYFKGNRNSSSTSVSSNHTTSSRADATVTVADKVMDIVEKANKSLPSENDVSGHKQRYHTRNGVEWRDKAPYHRGKNKNNQ